MQFRIYSEQEELQTYLFKESIPASGKHSMHELFAYLKQLEIAKKPNDMQEFD